MQGGRHALLSVRAAALAVLDLWQSSAENASRPVDTVDAVEVLLARDPGALIVAADGEELVGSGRRRVDRLARPPVPARRLSGPPARGDRRGAAAAETRLIGLGATRLDAMVLDGNDLGERIWRAAGYMRQDVWTSWVKPL